MYEEGDNSLWNVERHENLWVNRLTVIAIVNCVCHDEKKREDKEDRGTPKQSWESSS
jgi:hypothetical protein